MHRYAHYIYERFSPLQMLPLAALFGVAIVAVVARVEAVDFLVTSVVWVSATLYLFLFRLRLLDDIKDHQHDVAHHADRPGARGLVTQRELQVAAGAVACIEGVIAFQFGWVAFAAFAVMSAYSTALFLEALYHDRLREYFTLYITIHELLLMPFLAYVFLVAGAVPGVGHIVSYAFALLFFSSLFFLLEVARKVRSKDTEGSGRDTYTAQYGVIGATMVLDACAAIACVALILLALSVGVSLVVFSSCVLMLYAAHAIVLYMFAQTPTAPHAKRLFVASALYVAGLLLSSTLLIV